jgi:hypothetical protein
MPTEKPSHTFRDPGDAIAEDDYRHTVLQKDPEQSFAAVFLKLGRDYGGPFEARARAVTERLMLGQPLGHTCPSDRIID